VAGSCEHGNEPSGSVKDDNFLTSSVTIRFSVSQLISQFGSINSPLSSVEVKECVDLYLHSPIRLHGLVLS
jgi:hypothetical protein